MAAAARGSLTHRFELGGDFSQRHARIGYSYPGDKRHQPVFRGLARCPRDQMRLGQMLPDEPPHGAAQAFDRPRPRRTLQVEHADDVLPRVIGTHPTHRRQPGVDGSEEGVDIGFVARL